MTRQTARLSAVVLACAAASLASCLIFKPCDGPEQTAALIRSSALVGITVAFERAWDETEVAERFEAACTIKSACQAARQAVAGDQVTGGQVLEFFDNLKSADFPPELRVAIAAAVDLLLSHVDIEATTGQIPEEAKLYIQALLEGVELGAEIYCESAPGK
jgi:hypothetical protein